MRLTTVAQPLLATLLFSGVFIALVAVTLATETSQLLSGHPPDHIFLGFIFFATISAYNLHWHWSPPENHERLRKGFLLQWPKAHLILAVAGLAGSALLLARMTKDLLIILPALFLTFLYTAPKSGYPFFRFLRRIGFAKTFYLASVWTYVTTALPLAHQGYPWNWNSLLFFSGRFFLLYAICLLFDWRDRENDAAQGIRSMVSGLSRQGLHLIFGISLLLNALALCLLALRGWPEKECFILFAPGAFCAILYPRALSSRSEILFNGLIDGSLILPYLLRLFFAF